MTRRRLPGAPGAPAKPPFAGKSQRQFGETTPQILTQQSKEETMSNHRILLLQNAHDHSSKLLRSAATVLGFLAAIAAGAQLRPAAAQFMQAMNASMERMDRQMASAPMNGDVDHDFAAMMIPHHQGAIDMAKVELIYGKDPVMRRLNVVTSQLINQTEETHQ
ncbi:MAG TPA: DUF305 domain-containing protein [Terriglobales bacterium]|nr:DUF305 domain-containing protein [Terriglobales bacterium]